jgi:hypothetical protein
MVKKGVENLDINDNLVNISTENKGHVITCKYMIIYELCPSFYK